MAAAGVGLAFDLTRHSVIGLWEVVRQYCHFKRLFDQLIQLALDRQPEVIIGVDFGGFNLRFARAIRRRVAEQTGSFHNWSPRLVQYVSPQVWASRPWRARQLARDMDLLLSIFPFEKAWYAARLPQLRVEYVGHPLLDRYGGKNVPEAPLSAAGPAAAKADPSILLLPGSRRGELHRHWPVLLAAAQTIRHTLPAAQFRLVLPTEELMRAADEDLAALPGLGRQIGGLAGALAQSDLAFAATGTVTLECAFFRVPTVALYRTSWPTYLVAKQLAKVKFLAMPNLLAGEEIFPEFLQAAATPENLARAGLELLENPERCRQIKARLAELVRSLGPPGAQRRAAQTILRLLGPNELYLAKSL
jgi:lipid-A-disaccharide synthase